MQTVYTNAWVRCAEPMMYGSLAANMPCWHHPLLSVAADYSWQVFPMIDTWQDIHMAGLHYSHDDMRHPTEDTIIRHTQNVPSWTSAAPPTHRHHYNHHHVQTRHRYHLLAAAQEALTGPSSFSETCAPGSSGRHHCQA